MREDVKATSRSRLVHQEHQWRNVMNIRFPASRGWIALAALSLSVSACGKYRGVTAPSTEQPMSQAAGAANGPLAAEGSTNGAAGQMPAFYDGELFTVNMKELTETASASLIEKNVSVNEIYASNDLDEEQDFIPVIDAIQGDGFNPLWQQVLIVFNPGFAPHQFLSDEEIEDAAAGVNPEITLVETDEIYRCSVVGK